MRITQRQLRQVIREVLEQEAAPNSLEGEDAAFAMAFSLLPDTPKDGHEIRSFHRLVEIFLNGPNRDIISPEAQQDLALISRQIRKGFKNPDYLYRADIEKAFHKIVDIFSPDLDPHRITFYQGFLSPNGALLSKIEKINKSLRDINQETGYVSDYVHKQRVGAIVDNIAKIKSFLSSIPDSDIVYLNSINRSINRLASLTPEDVDPDYKTNFAHLISSGAAGVIQAAELIDILNQPDETDAEENT